MTEYDAKALDLLALLREWNGASSVQLKLLSDALYQERVDAIKECSTLAEHNGHPRSADLMLTLL